jgi:RHS repeat-associated protein
MSLRSNTTIQKKSRIPSALARPLPVSRCLVALVACLLVSPTFAETYTYDLAGRLTSVGYTDGSSIAYEYDANGNILRIAKAVGPLPPDGTIDTPDNDVTIFVNDSVNFTGTGADPDNALPLTYRWDFDGAAADSVDEDPGDIIFTAAGNYTVEFFVTDATNLTDPSPARRLITVQDAPTSQAPDGQIDTPAANVTITAGGSVNFTGSGSDPDNELPLTFLWTFDGAAADSNMEDPGDITFGNAGTYTVTLAVTDAAGVADPTPATRTITVNNPAGGGNGNNNGKKKGGGAVEIWMILFLLGGCIYRLPRKQKISARFALLGLAVAAATSNAAEWRSMESGTTLDLAAIWGSDATNVFAVGPAGTILHFDGSAWAPMDSGTTVDLNGVYGYAGDDVFVVGDSATILHYDGNAWAPFTGPNDENGAPETGDFVDVWTAGAGNDLYVITNRRAYYWDGATWLPRSFSDQFSATLTPETTLASIGGAAQSILVVGNPFSASGGEFYANFKDTPLFSTTVAMRGVFGLNANDMYLVGDGTFHFLGGNIRTSRDWIRMGPAMSDPVDVWAASSTDVFAVGRHFSGTRGQITYYDGNAENSWAQSLDTGNIGMTAVWGFSATDVFAVGEQGAIYRLFEGDPVLTAANYPHSGWLTETINAHTGELVFETTDLDLGGKIPVVFSRYYASGLAATLPGSGRLGRNWSHNYEWRFSSSADSVVIYTPRGRRLDFSNASGDWQLITEIGLPYSLQQEAGGGQFILLDETSGLMYSFFANTGRLAKISDRVGNRLNIGYIANFDPPVSVTDGRGRGFNMTYNATQQLVSVTAGANSTLRTYTFSYSDENLATVTGPENAVVRYTYDADPIAGRIVSVESASGAVPYTWTYGTDGKVSSETESGGTSFAIAYQSGTTPSQITAPDGSAKGIFHDPLGRMTTVVDEDGYSQRLSYTTTSRVATITDRFNISASLSYDPQTNLLTKMTGPDGRQTGFRYLANSFNGFAFQDLAGIDFADQTSRDFERSTTGLVTAVVDRANNRWEFEYDALGNLTRQTLPTTATLDFTYNADDTLATVTDPGGKVTRYQYDGAKRLAVIEYPGPDSRRRTLTWNAYDQLVATKDDAGTETKISYTADGEIQAVDLPLMPPITHSYDALGRLERIKTPKGDEYIARYDARGRPYQFEDPLGDIETFSYNNANRPTGLKFGTRPEWKISPDREGVPGEFDPPGSELVRLQSDSDPLGRIKRIEREGTTVGIEFDTNGRVVALESENGDRAEQQNFGPANAPSKQMLANTDVFSEYFYTPLGQLATVRDANGNHWTHEFNLAGLPSRWVDPLGRETRYDYDDRGRLARVEFPGALGSVDMVKHVLGGDAAFNYSDGSSLQFNYDLLGRLTGGTGLDVNYDDNGNLSLSNGIATQYDAADKMETIEFAPGKVVTYIYDDRGMVIGVRDWLGDAIQFQHDDLGRLAGIQRANGVETSLAYDTFGRLSDINVAGKSSISLARRPDGLVTAAQRSVPRPAGLTDISSLDYTHDAASQVNQFSYDARGRRTADDRYNYDWSISGRMTGYAGTSTNVTFNYDALGALIQRDDGASTVDYVWNYGLDLPSVAIKREAGADKRYFVHTPKGDLLYSIEADGSRRFFHYDENGNTVYLTDDSGAVIASYAYSPYGELLFSAGNVENEFTFVGQRGVMRDGDGDLYYMRARFYDAISGRFLSADPRQGKSPRRVNPYQYAQGNPLAYRDPTGHDDDNSLITWFTDQWTNIRNGGFGVANLAGIRWESAIAKVMADAKAAKKTADMVASLNRTAEIKRKLGRGRGITPHHAALERSTTQTAARASRGVTDTLRSELTQYAKMWRLWTLSGLVAGYVEDSDKYASTRSTKKLGKAGIFSINMMAAAEVPVAQVVAWSTMADVATETVMGKGQRFGLHEVLNAPARAFASLSEDVSNGRSLNPFSENSVINEGTATARLVKDMRKNRGYVSNGLATFYDPVISGTWEDTAHWAVDNLDLAMRTTSRGLPGAIVTLVTEPEPVRRWLKDTWQGFLTAFE